MAVLLLTVFVSMVLVVLFVLLFLYQLRGDRRSTSRDALMPLDGESSSRDGDHDSGKA